MREWLQVYEWIMVSLGRLTLYAWDQMILQDQYSTKSDTFILNLPVLLAITASNSQPSILHSTQLGLFNPPPSVRPRRVRG